MAIVSWPITSLQIIFFVYLQTLLFISTRFLNCWLKPAGIMNGLIGRTKVDQSSEECHCQILSHLLHTSLVYLLSVQSASTLTLTIQYEQITMANISLYVILFNLFIFNKVDLRRTHASTGINISCICHVMHIVLLVRNLYFTATR